MKKMTVHMALVLTATGMVICAGCRPRKQHSDARRTDELQATTRMPHAVSTQSATTDHTHITFSLPRVTDAVNALFSSTDLLGKVRSKQVLTDDEIRTLLHMYATRRDHVDLQVTMYNTYRFSPSGPLLDTYKRYLDLALQEYADSSVPLWLSYAVQWKGFVEQFCIGEYKEEFCAVARHALDKDVSHAGPDPIEYFVASSSRHGILTTAAQYTRNPEEALRFLSHAALDEFHLDLETPFIRAKTLLRKGERDRARALFTEIASASDEDIMQPVSVGAVILEQYSESLQRLHRHYRSEAMKMADSLQQP